MNDLLTKARIKKILEQNEGASCEWRFSPGYELIPRGKTKYYINYIKDGNLYKLEVDEEGNKLPEAEEEICTSHEIVRFIYRNKRRLNVEGVFG